MLMRRWRCCCSCSFYLRIIINYNVALSPLSLSIFPPSLVVVVATLLLCVLTQQLKHLCKHWAEKSPIHWTLDSGQCRPHRLSRSNPAVSSSHHVQINHTQWGASKMSRWQMIREQKSNKKYSNFKFFMILPDSICIHRERERERGDNQSLTAWALANLLIRMNRAEQSLSLSLSLLPHLHKLYKISWGRWKHFANLPHTHSLGRGLRPYTTRCLLSSVWVCSCPLLLLLSPFCACLTACLIVWHNKQGNLHVA